VTDTTLVADHLEQAGIFQRDHPRQRHEVNYQRQDKNGRRPVKQRVLG